MSVHRGVHAAEGDPLAASLVSKHVSVPITALQCVRLDDKVFILCGEGCSIKVISIDGTVYFQSNVLPDSTVIHGFRSLDYSTEENGGLIVAYGQRVYKILELSHKDDNISLCELSVLHIEEDWILDIQCIYHCRLSAHFILAIMFAHNRTVIFDSLKKTREMIRSEINCILYSAKLRFIESSNELVIAAGSVFNDVLITSCSLSSSLTDPLPVSLLLKGHEGVIFDVSFSDCGNYLVTVSDDRSVRTWTMPREWQKMRGCIVSCSNVFYGHASRVWSAEWLSLSLIVSIGEDATARLWDVAKGCVHVETGHLSGSIWSMAIDKGNKLVITGGGDCGIRNFSYDINNVSSEQTQFELSLPVGNTKIVSPRILCLVNETRLLCLTDTGTIFEVNIHQFVSSPSINNWRLFLNDAKFSKYAVMSVSDSSSLLAIGSLEGHVKLVCTLNTQVQYQWKPYIGKVYSLTWLTKGHTHYSANLLLSCGPSGEMICWTVSIINNYSVISIQPVWFLTLPQSKHCWVTSGVYLPLSPPPDPDTIISDPSLVVHPPPDPDTILDPPPDPDTILDPPPDPDTMLDPPSDPASLNHSCIICGDRKGSIHVYILDPLRKEPSQAGSSSLLPVQSFNGIHGSNQVTSINYWKGSVYTTGRDGYCRQFIVEYEENGVTKTGWKLAYINMFHPLKGIDWIESVVFTEDHGLITQTFHGNEFILHSSHLDKPLVTVSCGGGHRSSVVCSPNEIFCSNRVLFCYIKGSCVYAVSSDVSHNLVNNILQESFLGREVVSVCDVGRDNEGSLVMAVGSEDCSITLVSCGNSKSTFTVVKRLEEHISAVKALSCLHNMDNGRSSLLFSGGGRASLKAWMIYTDIPGIPVRLCCEHNLHNLPSRPQRRKKRMTEVPAECRIMSLTCFKWSDVIRCSDGQDNDIEVCVVAGCSDGVIRIYSYSQFERTFRTVQTIRYHGRCILTVEHAMCHVTKPPSHMIKQNWSLSVIPILCTCATDGDIVLWDLRCLLKDEHECQPETHSSTSQEETYSNTSSFQETHSCTTRNDQEENITSNSLEETRSSTSNGLEETHSSTSNDQEETRSSTSNGQEETYPGSSNCQQGTHSGSSNYLVSSSKDLAPLYCLKEAHQSGINGVAIRTTPLSDDSSLLIIASVGDDNSLMVHYCCVEIIDEVGVVVKCLSKLGVANAHYSTITGVGFLSSSYLITSSVDQRLSVWRITAQDCNNESMAVIEKMSSRKHNVADASSLLIYNISDNSFGVIVGGVGIQIMMAKF